MITLKELNFHEYPTDTEIDTNLQILCDKLNMIRNLWNHPMIVTSALRSEEQQEDLIKKGLSNAKRSLHLLGCAADILDINGQLKQWLKENPEVLENAELWCEASEYTPTWCHFQIYPPLSGKRWFIP